MLAYGKLGHWPDHIKYDEHGQAILHDGMFNRGCGTSGTPCIKTEYLPAFPKSEQFQCAVHRPAALSLSDIESQIRLECPGLPPDRVHFWGLIHQRP